MFAFLARLFLFMIAISVVRSVVTAVQRAFSGSRTSAPTRQAFPHARSAADNGATMLQQDPVCGTYVAVDSSLKRVVKGRVIHFCSPECRDKYAV
jgi:YHS domain-containing protein